MPGAQETMTPRAKLRDAGYRYRREPFGAASEMEIYDL
jgi:hypothetical protein